VESDQNIKRDKKSKQPMKQNLEKDKKKKRKEIHCIGRMIIMEEKKKMGRIENEKKRT
jgi:hypothetical protein